MSNPTPEQIQIVQTNLKNMQALNGYVYDHGLVKIQNAYLLLSEVDNVDPGAVVAINVIEGAFWAFGSLGGPIGNFAASFLSGMVSYWATNTPPSLNGQFASYFTRFDATTRQVDTQLATYYGDVAANWNTQFSYNGKTTTLSDLATAQFPAKTDPTFEAMAAKALDGLDHTLWKQMLVANDVITFWQPHNRFILPRSEGDPASWAQTFIRNYPAYYLTWSWHDSTGCGDSSGWQINEYNIGTGANSFVDGSLSSDACQYLFQDSTPGVITNASGLFTREAVFTNLGLKQVTRTPLMNDGHVPTKLSMSYLRAMKQGQTLGLLIEREGRDVIERRIIQKAHDDSIFANRLAMHPQQTLEEFLGVKIPEVVSVNVVVENPRTFGLIIPMANKD